jgi:hypothetical protein
MTAIAFRFQCPERISLSATLSLLKSEDHSQRMLSNCIAIPFGRSDKFDILTKHTTVDTFQTRSYSCYKLQISGFVQNSLSILNRLRITIP